MKELQPNINQLKTKISSVYKLTEGRIISTRNLIIKNIADAKNITSQRLISTRKLLTEAKLAARFASIAIQTCLNNQNIGLLKILPNSLIKCIPNNNFTALGTIRNKMLKLEQTATGLPAFCSLLNPLRSDMNHMRICIQTKLDDLKIQLVGLEKEFEEEARNVVNNSVKCIVQENGVINEKLGGVIGSIRSCRNVNPSMV